MKWKFYARKLYWTEFILLLMLVSLFLIDIFLLHYTTISGSAKSITGNILNGIMIVFLVRFILTESV